MRRTATLAIMALCAGCHRAPAANAHQEAAPSTRPIASAAPAAKPSADAAPLPPYLPDGCWSDVATDAGAGALLSVVAKRCVQGMQPLGKPLVKELAEGKQAELAFSLENADKCVRAAAAGGAGVGDVALSIEDSSGHVYGRDKLDAPFALVDDGGPVCLPKAGRYRVVARMERGAGRVAIEVWRAK